MSKREHGFALLVVLWTVVLLAMLVTQVVASGRGEAQLALNLRAAAAVEAAADGALAEGVFHALDSSERHWRADGTVHGVQLPGGNSEIRIDNEAGKINLNSADPELLTALLHTVGVNTQEAASLSASIADWRFVDAQRGGGAKATAYRAAGRSYGPPGAPFQSMQELGLVLGMTPNLLVRLMPHLTLFHDGAPDARVADAVVRQALLEETGAPPPARQGPPEENVIAITASVTGAGGAAFVRRAVVKLGARNRGGLFELLTWDGATP